MVEAGVVEGAADLLQREAELAAEEDLLQAQQVVLVSDAVAGLRARVGDEKPDVVVAMKRAHRDARDPGDLAHSVGAVRCGAMGASLRPDVA
jgi:hypothetical protein